MSANDGIKRGDGARTGDLGATPPGPEVTRSGSGLRGADEGPAGQPTSDPSAGGLMADGDFLDLDEADGIANEGTADIDDLTIVSADDPRLGLTNYGDVEAKDWAADTGPSRNPDRGVVTDSVSDTGSTLGPDRG